MAGVTSTRVGFQTYVLALGLFMLPNIKIILRHEGTPVSNNTGKNISFESKGYGPSKIQEEILLLFGVSVSRCTIRKWICRYKETCSLVDLPRRHFPGKLTEDHLNFMDHQKHENSEMTAMELRHRLRVEYGTNISKSVITKGRRQLGWRYTGRLNYESRKITDLDGPCRRHQT